MAERLRAARARARRCVVAHGKMPAAEIDEAMVGFADGEGDVLLATNIIESGLDVPRANTMLVWRADRFGLAQLHQLRGRVGRGPARRRPILLTDPEADARRATPKRLRTLEALDRLGAGFAISARDLDMRGAGDLLGEEQAGHVKLIGAGLYRHLLEGAAHAARARTSARPRPELRARHRRAASRRVDPRRGSPPRALPPGLHASRTAPGSTRFGAEMADRFGELPEEAEALLASAQVRMLARAAGVRRIDAGAGSDRDHAGSMPSADVPEPPGREGRTLATPSAGRAAVGTAGLDRAVLAELAGD